MENIPLLLFLPSTNICLVKKKKKLQRDDALVTAVLQMADKLCCEWSETNSELQTNTLKFFFFFFFFFFAWHTKISLLL